MPHSAPSFGCTVGFQTPKSGTTAREFSDIATQFDELRYHLLPYIYSAAWGVTHDGQTLMRALPLEFPSDPRARAVADQFLFGPALLINPVTTAGATQRSLYLPAGHDWIDFWTGKRVRGGQTVTAEAPLDRIPIYAKAGSIIPLRTSRAVGCQPRQIPSISAFIPGRMEISLFMRMKATITIMNMVCTPSFPCTGTTKSSTLTVGERRGSFPGMLEHQNVLRDRPREGVQWIWHRSSREVRYDCRVRGKGRIRT